VQVAGTVYASCLSDFFNDLSLLLDQPTLGMAPAELATAIHNLTVFMADHGMDACIQLLMAGAAARSLEEEGEEQQQQAGASSSGGLASAAAPAPMAAPARQLPGLREVVLGCRSARQVRAPVAVGARGVLAAAGLRCAGYAGRACRPAVLAEQHAVQLCSSTHPLCDVPVWHAGASLPAVEGAAADSP
jgi:hypothetical protein